MNIKTLTDNLKVLKTQKELERGILFRRLKKRWAFYFMLPKPKQVIIHSFFVFRTIDILLLDSDHRINETETLKPFKMFLSQNKINSFIELPKGSIKKYNIVEGDILYLN